jgi:hypothetical protein
VCSPLIALGLVAVVINNTSSSSAAAAQQRVGSDKAQSTVLCKRSRDSSTATEDTATSTSGSSTTGNTTASTALSTVSVRETVQVPAVNSSSGNSNSSSSSSSSSEAERVALALKKAHRSESARLLQEAAASSAAGPVPLQHPTGTLVSKAFGSGWLQGRVS